MYTRHRYFLKPQNPYWRLKKSFNGSQEHEIVPIPLTRKQVLERVEDINTVFGKTQKKLTNKTCIWKKINHLYPKIGKDSRNVRLGLAIDGMNHFGNLSTKHSPWPILLVIYNLPPLLFMKQKYMLSMIISGPRQPGNDINVYLNPLIEDLRKLWDEGVDMFDSYQNEKFKLCAMVF